MKQIFRILSIIALVFLGAGQTWAQNNSRVTFVYEEDHGTASASVDGSGKVTITVTPVGDYRCIAGDVTAETVISSINAGVRTRTSSINYGEPIVVTCTKTNEFTLQLPADENEEVRVTIRFSDKDTFTPDVYIYHWTYGETANAPTVGDSNESGGEVTYTYADTEYGTYSTTVPTRAGTHWVKATVAATADYKECESSPSDFEIERKTIRIDDGSVSVKQKVYDGKTTATLNDSFSFEDGMIVGNDKVSIDASGASATFEDANANTDKSVTVAGLALAGEDKDNYTLENSEITITGNITKKGLTVTANNKTIDYGDAPANNGVEYDGFVNGEDESVLPETLGFEYTYTQYGPVGTYQIMPKDLTSDNYNIGFEPGTLTVKKRMLTFDGSDVSGIEKEYDGTTDVANLDEIDIRPQSIYNNDDVKVVVVSGSYASKNVGNNIEVTIYEVDLTGDDQDNYDIDNNPVVKTRGIINQRHVKITGISVTPKAYDGEDWAEVDYNSAVFDRLVKGDDVKLYPLNVDATYESVNVGTGIKVSLSFEDATLTGNDEGNYTLDRAECVGETTGNINKASLTVTAKDKTIYYGGDGANDGVDYDGFVENEDENKLDGSLTYSYGTTDGETFTPYAPGDPVGTYEIKPNGFTSDNYDITFNPGTLTVLPVIVKVSVVDIANGEELEGATIQILDSENNVAKEWTSTTETHVIEDLFSGRTYTLKETVAPDGYLLPTDYTFTIDEDGKITSTGTVSDEGVLLVENSKTRVEVSVVDTDENKVQGATVQVLCSEGVVDEWSPTTENHVIEGLKTGVEYTVHETVAPVGYVLPTNSTFTIDTDGKVTFSGTKTTDGVLLVENSKTHVEVSAVDIANGEELAGVHVQVIEAKETDEEKVVEEWDSTTENHVIEGLKTGEEFTLRETVAPDGYVLSTDKTFTIAADGKITFSGSTTTDESGNTVLLVQNSKTHVEVSVVDIADRNNKLEGATVQVIDSEGGTVEEWTSTTESHVIEGLKTGEEYTLRETVVPEDYLPFTDNTFTIAADGTISYSGTMTDDKVLLVENSIPVDVSVAVAWDDDNNTEGFRPESVTARLLNNGVEIDSKVLTAKDNWSCTFTGLYKYNDGGDEITYTVTEDNVENYETPVIEKNSPTEWDYTVTNSRTVEVTEATVKVVWVDAEDELGKRPESVTATLVANGTATENTVTMNAGNNWTATAEHLQKYSNGTAIVYTWTQDEDALPDGYTLTNTAVADAVTTFTDSYYPAVTVTITGHNNETTYDGTEHTTNGYEVTNISYSLYTEADFTFNGEDVASQTTVGTKNMGLDASLFTNDNANYENKVTFKIAADGYQTITPAPVTVKADDKSKVWGTADDPTLTATVTGMVNDEDAKTLISYTIDRAHGDITNGVENSGEYAITPSGDATQGNYAVTYKTGIFTIEGKPTTIQDAAGNDVSSVDNTFTITQDQDGVTLTLVTPETTSPTDPAPAPVTVDIPKVITVDHVTIDRSFAANKAATVYLPFTILSAKVTGGAFHKFTGVDETKTPWEVIYTELAADESIEANTPYIFLPSESMGGKITVDNGNTPINVCTAGAKTTHDATSKWEFIGTYEPIKWLSDPAADGYNAERAAEIGYVYGFAAEDCTVGTTNYSVGQFVKVGSGAYINPMRAYLKRTTTNSARGMEGIDDQPLPATMKVVLISANGVSTTIGTFTLDYETGDWYSLDGRKLNGQPTKKGLYINNGKKVAIK